MQNLIVTIIVIALAAILGLSAMYYGGSAYMKGNEQIRASQYTSILNNYAFALQLWSQKNGQTFPRPNENYPMPCSNEKYCSASDLQNILGPRYLQTTELPPEIDTEMLLYWDESSMMRNPVLILRLKKEQVNDSVCKTVETIRQGTRPEQLRKWGEGSININRYMCGKIGCIENDGTFGPAENFPFVTYTRLGAQPDITKHDEVNPDCRETSAPNPTPIVIAQIEPDPMPLPGPAETPAPTPPPLPMPDPSPAPVPDPLPSPMPDPSPAPAPNPSPAPDTTPDAFNVGPDNLLYLLSLGSTSSNVLIPSGYNAATSISVTCTSCNNTTASYRINGGAWTSSPGTISPGDSVQVRISPTPIFGLGSKIVTLTIGGVSDTYTVSYVLNL